MAGCFLQLGDRSGDVFSVFVLVLGPHFLSCSLHPVREGDHLGAGDVERGQDSGDVLGEGRAFDNDRHLLGRKGLGILKMKVSRTVESNGGLSGSRATLEDNGSALRAGNHFELLRVDQRSDLLEMLILAERFGRPRLPSVHVCVARGTRQVEEALRQRPHLRPGLVWLPPRSRSTRRHFVWLPSQTTR